jgi:hypothetical protein
MSTLLEKPVSKISGHEGFSYSAYKTWTLGQTLFTDGLFKGVDDEPLAWRIVEIDKDQDIVYFTVTYFGIYFGDFKLYLSKNKPPVLSALAAVPNG